MSKIRKYTSPLGRMGGVLLLLLFTLSASAKVKIGLRGGMNVTDMSFNKELFQATNRQGFFIGPTLKLDLPLGFDIDLSAMYNQIESDSELYITTADSPIADERYPSLKRKSLAVPLNIRKGFGFGDNFDIFVFAGPQIDMNIGGDIEKSELRWQWSENALSVNVGVGLMLLKHVEVKANYNIPCGTTGEFTSVGDILNTTKDAIKAKSAAWQIGLAYYF